MDFNGYVDRVNFHLTRMNVDSRPSHQAYMEAYSNQVPPRKLAASYARRIHLRREQDDDSEE
jgi:hypothetical protein